MNPLRTTVLILGVTLVVACAPTPTNPTTTSTTSTTSTTTTQPPEIAITTSTPASPGASTTPSLIGFAPPATSVVRIFASTDCSGSAVANGSLSAFTTTGIPVTVGLGTTTAFTALASGPALSACSAAYSYVNTLMPPNGYEHEPNGTLAEANPVVADVGQPADIAGQLDGPVGPYNSDNFTFAVVAGRSIRIETFDWTGATCDLIDTHIYLYPPSGQPGGNDDSSGIGLCSLIDPGIDLYAANVAGGTYRVLVQGSGGDYRVRISVLP